MRRDTTTGRPGDGGIKTRQGCCTSDAAGDQGTTAPHQECCGSDATAQPSGAATPQSSCCDDLLAERDTCCGDDCGDGGSASGKSRAERERIRTAAEQTDAVLDEMAAAWRPDWTEADVAEFLHARLDERGDDAAWSRDYCPAVHAGAEAVVGHTRPTDRTVPAGELLHVDFGVVHDGYAADLQRLFYHPTAPDEAVPADVQAAFADVRAALDAGLDALEPGVSGHEVDAAAREALTARGWPEFQHAFGHQVGQRAHDGGTLLGPPRERYGDRPRGDVQVGEVYSVELGVGTQYGFVGQEEMVHVGEDGAEFLVAPQRRVRRLEVGR